jgi:CO/xanthine dehydrogenase FAD-binding subunit
MIYTPASLDEALALLSTGNRVPLAGATDYMVIRKKGKTDERDMVSLDRLEELKVIRLRPEGLHIGSMVTFSRLEREALAPDCLRQAAALVGGPQIRNRGTLGGNILTASPAADSVPALAVLDARLILLGQNGRREAPLESFIPAPGELLVDILLPPRPGRTIFYKLGKRNALSISMVNMALRVDMEQDRFGSIAIALGSVAPHVVRARKAEEFLRGKARVPDILKTAAAIMAEEISPISDIRASTGYRRAAALSVFISLVTVLSGGETDDGRNNPGL